MAFSPAFVAAIAADVLADLPAAYPATGREFVALRRNGEMLTFNSSLGDHELLVILAQIPGEFAESLLRSARGNGLSERQEPWAHKIANDWIVSQTAEAAEAASENAATFAAIVAILVNIPGRSKSFQISKDCMLALSRCKGKVWVKNPSRIVDGDYGPGPEFIGTISPKWGISDKLPEGIRQQIIGFVDSMTH